MSLSGCGKAVETGTQNGKNKIKVLEETTITPEERQKQSEEGQKEDSARERNVVTYAGMPYTWNEITVVIPDAWKDKYIVEKGENGFSFIQKSSNEKQDGMGYICGFYRSEGPVFELAGEQQLAYTDTQMYSLTLPTDVSYYYEDKDIEKEYNAMGAYITAMADAIEIAAKEVHYNPKEYIIAMSECYPLKAEDLSNFNDNELWMGRNEIFARHGIKFRNTLLQEHFNACSWYKGNIDSDKFDETVLSETEKANLELIKEAESNYKAEHPYPIKEKVGENIRIDLNEDGSEDTLAYQLTKVNQESDSEYKAYFTINGAGYLLEDFEICLENPEEMDYYITDISPHFPGLEVAVMDYGPSDDEATYFFTYDGELHYLGEVGGIPFKEKGEINGFAESGSVRGIIRTDIIDTCYGYASWWYDYDNQKLEFQDTGYYPMLPTGAHELYTDLPVYTQMKEDSLMTFIPAQKEVFFTITDGTEWIQVKGKDGSAGFMHVKNDQIDKLGKPASEVFSNLMYYD
ncbi:MAG: YARHG domain-containing protein [Lachnospiraceae bacterium]|nr:YARHG domain-containing protein [Lachnospiraceae bacterium]